MIKGPKDTKKGLDADEISAILENLTEQESSNITTTTAAATTTIAAAAAPAPGNQNHRGRGRGHRRQRGRGRGNFLKGRGGGQVSAAAATGNNGYGGGFRPHQNYQNHRHRPYQVDNRRGNGVRGNHRGGRDTYSCKRCLSRNGSHSAFNCPSTVYCRYCKNASHAERNCKYQ